MNGKTGWIAALVAAVAGLGGNAVQYAGNEGELELAHTAIMNAQASIVHQNELLRQCMAGHIDAREDQEPG